MTYHLWMKKRIVRIKGIFQILSSTSFYDQGILGGVLLTMHNLRFFVRLMEEARGHILAGTFANWSRN